jgi:hypothetical protein
MAVGIRHADHVAPSIRKKKEIGRSVGMVRLRTEATNIGVGIRSADDATRSMAWETEVLGSALYTT